MITFEPAPDGGCRYGWHWSLDFNRMTPVTELANNLVKLEIDALYLVLSLLNDKYSNRWALVTDGNVIAWQRIVFMKKT